MCDLFGFQIHWNGIGILFGTLSWWVNYNYKRVAIYCMCRRLLFAEKWNDDMFGETYSSSFLKDAKTTSPVAPDSFIHWSIWSRNIYGWNKNTVNTQSSTNKEHTVHPKRKQIGNSCGRTYHLPIVEIDMFVVWIYIYIYIHIYI